MTLVPADRRPAVGTILGGTGVYARISDDDAGLSLGVNRQIDDCTSAITSRGLAAPKVYIDNDVSASKAKRRPKYEEMLADVRAGRIKTLAVWDVDRLTRKPRELEDIIDLAATHGLDLISIGGEIDLKTEQGRLTARIKGAVAKGEAEAISRRTKRKLLERAEAGLPTGGPRPYGYRREYDTERRTSSDVLMEKEAQVIRWLAARVLTGHSIRSLVEELNHPTDEALKLLNDGKPIPTPRAAAKWSHRQVTAVLLRERNAGRRVHHGAVIGDTSSVACIYVKPDGSPDPAYHDRVVAVLTAPERRPSYSGRTMHYLLSNLAVCGVCDAPVKINIRRTGTTTRHRSYVCPLGHVGRGQSTVDEVVNGAMISRLADPNVLTNLATGDEDELAAARDRKADAQARLALAVSALFDGGLDQLTAAAMLARAKGEAAQVIADADRVIELNMPATLPTSLPGATPDEQWEMASLEVKRALIRATCRVVILPTRQGKRFDPASLQLIPVTPSAGATPTG